jgi:DNA repair protein RecN (Recombination protein N)
MLRFLRIRNLAVIESAEVEFEPGFNVLTGETGAGKSILVEAVGLLLGARATSDLVRTGETQASIEALFEERDGEELLVRREITSQGRSRSFVNGTLATATALRDIAGRLVELHGQHEHQALLDPLTHLALVDDHGRFRTLVEAMAEAWSAVKAFREKLDRATMDVREREARRDLLEFQLGEIERVAPKPREDEELTAVRQVLSSADRVQRLCAESFGALYDSDQAVLSSLAAIRKRIGELAAVEPQFEPYLAVSDGIKSQLEDLAWFVRSYGERIDASPERLQQVEDRLASLERLKRKYGPRLEDVFTKWEALKHEQILFATVGERSEELRLELNKATRVFSDCAHRLSGLRRDVAVRFSRDLEELLGDLAMANARFEVRFNEHELSPEEWGAHGIDQAEFFVSPNPGEELRPLARIVSGGELSRVMLALKTLMARKSPTTDDSPQERSAQRPTLIFDEVDAGIGGQVADVVGARLQTLGGECQVICITHLQQIAARGATQFRIAKAVRNGRTVTSVHKLTGDERVQELARMIAGARPSETAVASARELLERARMPQSASKQQAKGESESPAVGESEGGRRPRRR